MVSVVPYHYLNYSTLTHDFRGLLCWTVTHCGINWLRHYNNRAERFRLGFLLAKTIRIESI